MPSFLPSQKRTLLLYILLWFILATLGTTFRLYPLFNFSRGDTGDKAAILVIHNLRNQIKKEIDKSHPNLSLTQKDVVIKNELDKLLHREGPQVRDTIEKIRKDMLRGTAASKHYPYLLESDPFYYYQLTEKILTEGKMSDAIKGSKYLNRLMLAPEGHWEPLNFNPYVGALLYKFMRLFSKETELMYAVSFTPLLVTALSLIPFLWICYQLKCQPLISLTAGTYFLLAPIFIKRSSFGWFDNDPYNTFFPLCILSIFIYGFSHLHKRPIVITASLLGAVILALYSFFWHGWVFLFSILIISFCLTFLYNKFILKDTLLLQNHKIYFSLFLGTSFFLLSLAFGAKDFFILFKEGWVALTNFLSPQLSFWPDLYITVGELHKITLAKLIEQVGGPFFFCVGLGGVTLALIQSFQQKSSPSLFFTIILSLFFFSSLFLALGAQRFALIFLTPLTLAFLIGLEISFSFIRDFFTPSIAKNKLWQKSVNAIFLFLISTSVLFPIKFLHHSIESVLNPIFNATWEKALIEIREKTPVNSIINAWWPPGHFIKAISHRAVTFDGATINFPQAYWLANVFLTPSEKQALSILRMLNSSANQAAQYLESLGFKTSEAVEMIQKIILLKKDQTQIILHKKLKGDQIDHLLKLTHSSPPPSYLFLYNEFVDNNIQLSFIANWNFKKIEEINSNPNLLKKVPRRDSKEYIQFLWNLSGGPYPFANKLMEVSRSDELVIFNDHTFLNLSGMDFYLLDKNQKKKIPLSTFYLQNDKIIEKKEPQANLPYSVILFKEHDKYGSIMLDRRLAQSLLIQLYFFEGKGLRYIQPFLEESDLTKRTVIKVFSVNWEDFIKDMEGK